MQPTISEYEGLIRLVLAVLLGAAVGLEREARDRTAGFRTHILVCLGSAVFTIISAYGYSAWWEGTRATSTVMDPTRIAAQIVSGIGFLGAGAILRSGINVKGLTTAAALWVVAAIGMAVGIGAYVWAVGATALVVFTLMVLKHISYRFVNHDEQASYNLTCALTGKSDLLNQWLIDQEIEYDLLEISNTETGFNVVYRIMQDDDQTALHLLQSLLDETWADKVELKSEFPL